MSITCQWTDPRDHHHHKEIVYPLSDMCTQNECPSSSWLKFWLQTKTIALVMFTSVTIAIQCALGKHAFWIARVRTRNSPEWFPVTIATRKHSINNAAGFHFLDISHHHYRHNRFLLRTLLQFHNIYMKQDWTEWSWITYMRIQDLTRKWDGARVQWNHSLIAPVHYALWCTMVRPFRLHRFSSCMCTLALIVQYIQGRPNQTTPAYFFACNNRMRIKIQWFLYYNKKLSWCWQTRATRLEVS